MTPSPQELFSSGVKGNTGIDAGDRVVISGMSGLYPNAHHVTDLADILYNKVNPITSDKSRFNYNHPEVTHYIGQVPDLQYFDAQFFKVHFRLGNSMDSMGRKILEQTYQAIYDAGISPENLSGKKVGVYVGSCFSETEKASFYVANSRTGFGIAGCSKTMFANRISYWLNVKGPSMSVDQACCSATAAVEMAHQAIVRGECDAAVVGGANLCLHPQSLVHYSRIMELSKDGKTRSFDENAAGCAKSDAINVLFLQKARDALRIYAEIVHVKSQFTSLLEGPTGPQYGFNRNPNDTVLFLKEFYEEAKIPPQAVEYVEAYGSANLEADKAELEALETVFCTGRNSPLLVGSVMSNVGYSEAASGITAITKVLLGYQKGLLAGNMHCESPRRDLPALRDGRMRVVTDHTPFRRSYVAVNGLSIAGVNAHVLLHGHYKPKDRSRYESTIPHLVLVSGRQDSAVTKVLDYLKSRPIDPEEVALLHNIHLTRISGNLGRGYTILGVNEQNETVSLGEEVAYFDYVKRPLWFVYSGMGSQWAGMGQHLMRIPVFAAAIQRCHRALHPKGLDIVHIITTSDKSIFDNILHSFVGIAAIQIGLTDVLRELGIVPDKIIGHSVGELGCAYADGCFTAEEMILSAYSRGLVSVQTPFIHGAMAAVGIGYQQIIPMCPAGIEVACHNSADSCTISGPADAVREFLTKLKAQNIFAKEVPCSNIAYHSRYIADAGPGLLKYLSEVIKDPKPRSERWVSTSVPMDRWHEDSAKYSSAEYHTNNLLRPVLFEESSRLVPANAVLVEVAPHGLLQAILKRSLPSTARNVPLTRRSHPDNTLFLLDAIGKLYLEGFNPNIQALYPKIEFPVSTETPMLSHLVEWAHHEKWRLPLYSTAMRKTAAATRFIISLHDDEYAFLQGHVIRGKILYPFAAALTAVWDTLAMSSELPRRQVSVQFREVELHAQPVLHERRQLALAVALHRGTGRFEVIDDINSKIASGFVHTETDRIRTQEEVNNNYLEITSNEIYKNFISRDYCYRDGFKSIHSVNSNITEALVVWRDNWVTFLDGMIQLNLLKHSLESHSHPSFIGKIIINPELHCKNENTIIKATVQENHNLTRCGGVVMENVNFRDLQMPEDTATLKVLKFVPHFNTSLDTAFDFETVLQIYMQIVTENIETDEMNVLGIYDDHNTLSKLGIMKKILDEVSEVTIRYRWHDKGNFEEYHDNLSNANVVLVFNLATDDNTYKILSEVLQNNAFVINVGKITENLNISRPGAPIQMICRHTVESIYVELARWRPTRKTGDTAIVTVNSASDFPVISDKQQCLLPHQRLLILTTHPAPEGLKEYLNHFKIHYGCNFRVAMSNNGNFGGLDAESLANAELSVSVFENDVLGGDYFVPLQNVNNVNNDISLRCSIVGQLESLRWEEISRKDEAGIPIKVHYAGLSDLDVKRATGLIPFDNNLSSKGYGMDFSGVTESGTRVMGLVAGGAASSHVLGCPELLWPVPPHWSLEDAATVPLAYCLAYYCLTLKFRLLPGARVLVQSGAGALGQALIAVALANGCEVFATVGDTRKKQFLLKMFPALKPEYIGNSRDCSFCDMVLNATNGKGVNFVICNLQGERKIASMKCVGASGLFIDVALVPNKENFVFGMNYLRSDRSYFIVNFSSIFKENETIKKRLQRQLCEGIVRGWVQPLSRVVYEPQHAVRALRVLAAANQRGRALLRLRNSQPAQSAQPAASLALSSIQCSPDVCHVIISDHECFGQHLADKLVSRGVRKLCLFISLCPKELKFKIRQWERAGVEVTCEALSKTSDILKSFVGSLSLGPIEGIYIALTNKSTPILLEASLVEKMDIVSRKLFPNVKYFAVINTVNSVGTETCRSRVLNGFAGTMIRLPEIKEMGVDEDTVAGRVSVLTAVAAAERALCAAAPAVTAAAVRSARLTLLQQLAQVAGITINEGVDVTKTLSDLCINQAKLNNISIYLRDTHNIFLTLEDINTLTVQRINEIDDILTKKEFDDEKGLKTLFSFVDSDELLATTEMLFLPTLTSNSTTRADEFDVSETYLCVVPGVEGHYGRFRLLCERLKLPALVLQPGLHHPHETVRDTARRYAEILIDRAGLNTNFYLLGYESGVLVALELAALLEDHGLNGTVFCLGVPPSDFNAELRQHLSGLETEEALQDAVLRHMFALMTGDEGAELDVALRGAAEWRERVEMAVRLLLGRVPHSAQYARQLIDAAHGRLAMLLRHAVEPRALRSRLVLLQPASAPPRAAALQPHSQQPVAAHALRAPLAHAPQDLRCAAIINSYLDDNILRVFQKKNLCESYLLNADSFMSPVE